MTNLGREMEKAFYDKLVKAARAINQVLTEKKEKAAEEKSYKAATAELFDALDKIGKENIGRTLTRIQSNVIDGAYELGILNVVTGRAGSYWGIWLKNHKEMAKAWRKIYQTLSPREKEAFDSIKTPYGDKIRVNRENGQKLLALAEKKPELSPDDVGFLRKVLLEAGWLEDKKPKTAAEEKVTHKTA